MCRSSLECTFSSMVIQIVGWHERQEHRLMFQPCSFPSTQRGCWSMLMFNGIMWQLSSISWLNKTTPAFVSLKVISCIKTSKQCLLLCLWKVDKNQDTVVHIQSKNEKALIYMQSFNLLVGWKVDRDRRLAVYTASEQIWVSAILSSGIVALFTSSRNYLSSSTAKGLWRFWTVTHWCCLRQIWRQWN